MNALNEFGKQISDLFASMTPSARIMAGLMLGVIVVSLGWILSSQQSTNYEYLFGGRDFSDAELERWEATFGEAELRDYERIGKRIKIPVGQKDAYLKALSAAGVLPKEWGGYIDAALNSNSPWDPNSLINLRAETAKERELSVLIRRIPGIEFAAVEFDEQRTGFSRTTDKVCSVSVQAHGNTPIKPETLKMIAQMAHANFAGLPRENVTVTDLGATQSYRPSGDPNSAEENPYLKAQADWERMYYDKVSNVLSNYGAVQLAVNVELDPKLMEESEKLQYDPTAVTVQTTESRKDLLNSKAAPAGPPGAASNGVSNQPQSISSTAAGQSSTTKESEANERRVAGHEAIVTKMAPMVPRKVSVSVGIPDSYYRKIWAFRSSRDNPDQETKPPTPAELTALKTEIDSSVRAAIEGIPVGIREGDDRKPYIQVYAYTDLPMPELPEITLAENTLAWLGESWSTLALLAVVLVSIGMMFSWVRATGAADRDRQFAEGFGLEVPDELSDELELSSDGSGSAGEASDGPRSKPTFDITGEEIKEDLSSLIKENPDAAVNLLKTWISEAA